MIRIILFISFSLLCLSESFAEAIRYNGPQVYDLVGSVKSVITTPQPQFAFKKVEFTEDGLIKMSWLTFDDTGMARGSNQNLFGLSLITKIIYNEDGRPIEYDIRGNMKFRQKFHAINTYNGSNVSKTVIVENKKNPKEYIYEYSDYQFDPKGNWISRNVDLTVKDSKGDVTKESKKYKEERIIEYFI